MCTTAATVLISRLTCVTGPGLLPAEAAELFGLTLAS